MAADCTYVLDLLEGRTFPSANAVLARRLRALRVAALRRTTLSSWHVRGHSGNGYNELADVIAK